MKIFFLSSASKSTVLPMLLPFCQQKGSFGSNSLWTKIIQVPSIHVDSWVNSECPSSSRWHYLPSVMCTLVIFDVSRVVRVLIPCVPLHYQISKDVTEILPTEKFKVGAVSSAGKFVEFFEKRKKNIQTTPTCVKKNLQRNFTCTTLKGCQCKTRLLKYICFIIW